MYYFGYRIVYRRIPFIAAPRDLHDIQLELAITSLLARQGTWHRISHASHNPIQGEQSMSPTRAAHINKEELIARCLPFLEEVKDMTTDSNVEQWLNTKYGVDSALYKDLARLIRRG